VTRGEIKRRVRMYYPESPGSTGWDDPFALDSLIKDAANEVARLTDCYEDIRYLDVTAGTQTYCSPDTYRPVAVFIKNSSGDWERMRVMRSHDDNFDQFRFDQQADPSTHVGFRGGNQLLLAPTPSVTRAAGLMVEGYCQPGEYWVYDSGGTAQAPTDSDECPLPVWAHDAVVYNVLAKRAEIAREFNASEIFRRQYKTHLGDAEAKAGLYRARSAKDYTVRQF
jgi:hypothetical protein